jgi:hypothetical protein
MKNSRIVMIVCLLGCVTCAFMGQVASSSASDASIKRVIKSYNSKILVAEGHVVSAIGEYKHSGNPKKVQTALAQSIVVLGSLKSAIAKQSASSPKIKEAKTKIEKGLHAVILAYRRLAKAVGEKHASPHAAKAEAKAALSAVKKGSIELHEGAQLLG